ncbi:GTPase IMAP family member 7 [Salmo trutta]|uniref:GTPase IMAP family member 7-like n=1 Tax=Salmo trutta TaxID=8032 RepID=A0A673YFJ2_SALTR|nr:GTPase IMAP family member 7-like [Salmo trutta]
MASSSGTVERKRASISVPLNRKSATGNTILGREAFKVDSSPESVTKACEKQSREANGRKIEVLDTPGLGEDRRSEIARCIMDKSIPIMDKTPCVPAGGKVDRGRGGTLKWIQQNVGEDALDYIMILVTCADSPRLRGNSG